MSIAPKNPAIGFGDTVRIVTSPATFAAGVAGLEGEAHGFTTPSVTAVAVIDPTDIDFAFGVYVAQLGRAIWLEPSLLELLSQPAESIWFVGSNKIIVTRDEVGGVVETNECVDLKSW